MSPRRGKRRGPCRHCARVLTHKGRGLCHACYSDPEVRESYAPLAASGRRLPSREKPKACEPTQCPPKTPEWFQVKRQRFLAGEELWHPDDAKEEEE
jgi:hypothetical protein